MNFCVSGPEAIDYFQVMDLQITNSWEIFRVQPAFRSSLPDTWKVIVAS